MILWIDRERSFPIFDKFFPASVIHFFIIIVVSIKRSMPRVDFVDMGDIF